MLNLRNRLMMEIQWPIHSFINRATDHKRPITKRTRGLPVAMFQNLGHKSIKFWKMKLIYAEAIRKTGT